MVEDHRGTRKNLVSLLDSEPGLRCLGSYATGEEAVKSIPLEKPDVAVVDINLQGMSGIECVGKLKAQMPNLQVLMLTTYEESDLIFSSLRAGANGYLLKSMPPEELVEAIEQVHAGGSPMSMQIARKVVDHFHAIRNPTSEVEKLSPKEQEILALLAGGCLYKQIADQVGISLNTVKTHVRVIYEKLHVQSRTQATVKYLKRE